MGVVDRDTREISGRIVYFGSPGSGTTTNLRFIYRKLKKDHRGKLETRGAGYGSGGAHEFLPVELGLVRGFKTTIHLYSVPQGAQYVEERRALLEDVDGVVFVADLRPDHHRATLSALKELETHLKCYGRSISEVVMVLQYNHRDEAQENALEALHRAIWVEPAAVLEAVASEGTGVLGTLTTMSKLILGRLRRDVDEEQETGVLPAVLASGTGGAGERAVVAEPAGELEATVTTNDGKGFRVESSGPVIGGEGEELQVPVVLVEEESGRRVELCLRVNLDPR